jgi:hypothetical protein
MFTSTTKYLRKLPAPLAKAVKNSGIYPHYWKQAAMCRIGYMRYGDRYKHNVLFVAGTPKSGTTWLENMLGCFPGYGKLLIPEAQFAIRGEAFNLPDDMFARMQNMLVVSKMHISWSEHNTSLLAKSGVPYVIQYRDFRDMYVSDYFYIKLTPWHYHHARVKQMTMDQYVAWRIETHLPGYCALVDSWRDNRNTELSLMLRYEDLLDDTFGWMKKVRDLYALPATDEQLAVIVDQNSFANLSKGRDRGTENKKSHFRKGVAGDWKSKFTEQHKDAIKKTAGDWLIQHGYESDFDW